jgi:site-specific DNA-methyltransferase (adenine-specific)
MNDDCLPALTSEQFSALLEDIRERGVQTAVEIDAETGEILDGRARVRICGQLRIRNYPRRVISGLRTEEDRRRHRLKANCLRRQMDKAMIKSLVLDEMRRKPESDRVLAAIFGYSHTAIANWRREFVSGGNLLPTERRRGRDGKNYPVRPPTAIYTTTAAGVSRASKLLHDLGDAAPGGTVSPRRAGTLALQAKRAHEPNLPIALPRRLTLLEGRFQDQGRNIKRLSVDCLFTDPPYGGDWLDQWDDLGELAARTLKRGGLLITYAGVAYLDRVMHSLESAGLTYIWTCCVPHGAVVRLAVRRVDNRWKPLLIYGQRIGRLPDTVLDLLAGGRQKQHHEWEQPESECEYYLSRLVPRGGVVLDSCCGSGTTLAVAQRLNLEGIGIDCDPGAIALARSRLGSRSSDLRRSPPRNRLSAHHARKILGFPSGP